MKKGVYGTLDRIRKWDKMNDLSLIIITKNEEKHVEQCVKSVLETLSNIDLKWEIILVDSASTDKTIENVMHYPLKLELVVISSIYHR